VRVRGGRRFEYKLKKDAPDDAVQVLSKSVVAPPLPPF
jgi:hypothetical protein